MPLWYFEKKDLKSTPSIRDGVDAETEQRYRREGCRFILDLGIRLGLSVALISFICHAGMCLFVLVDDRRRWELGQFSSIVSTCFTRSNNILDM